MPKKKETVLDVPETEEEQKAMYACLACKAIFKEAGMCPNCNMLLKKKAG